MTNDKVKDLQMPFAPNEVQWRLMLTTQKDGRHSGLAVPYLDSRAIQKRLDAVVGAGNWQNTFKLYQTGNAKDPTAHICIISIYDDERKEWVSKSNGAGNTDIEPVKGGMSDALKRAASMWNIGRYLYDFEAQWVNVEMRGNSKVIAKGEQAKLDQIYDNTVRRLFPQLFMQQKPQQQRPPQQMQTAHQPQQQPPAQKAPQYIMPPAIVYTVINATLNNNHTIINLWDGKKAFKAYFNGTAKVAKNQRIINAVLVEKGEGASRYYILESFNIAANQEIAA
jgi:hypothetical protein